MRSPSASRTRDSRPARPFVTPPRRSDMNDLQFEDGGRTFTCKAASSPATPETVWWWVQVSGDGNRYAAFRKASGDTAASVRPRIVAYYTKMLEDKARPPAPRVSLRQRPAAAPAAPAESPPTP